MPLGGSLFWKWHLTIWSGVRGLPGVLVPLGAHDHMFWEWLFTLNSFLLWFLFLLSFSLPLPFPSSLFFWWGGGAAAPLAPPLPTPLLYLVMIYIIAGLFQGLYKLSGIVQEAPSHDFSWVLEKHFFSFWLSPKGGAHIIGDSQCLSDHQAFLLNLSHGT